MANGENGEMEIEIEMNSGAEMVESWNEYFNNISIWITYAIDKIHNTDIHSNTYFISIANNSTPHEPLTSKMIGM